MADRAVATLSPDADIVVLALEMLSSGDPSLVPVHTPATSHTSQVHGAPCGSHVVGVALYLAGKNIPFSRGRAGGQVDSDGGCVGGGGSHIKVHVVAC